MHEIRVWHVSRLTACHMNAKWHKWSCLELSADLLACHKIKKYQDSAFAAIRDSTNYPFPFFERAASLAP